MLRFGRLPGNLSKSVENRHMANVMRHSIYILTIIIITLTKHAIDTIVSGWR